MGAIDSHRQPSGIDHRYTIHLPFLPTHTQPYAQSDDITRVSRAAKIMERMVNQNTFDEIGQGGESGDMCEGVGGL